MYEWRDGLRQVPRSHVLKVLFGFMAISAVGEGVMGTLFAPFVAARMRELPLGRWTWLAFGLLFAFLFVTVIVPISGIALRAFVTNWGFGVNLREAFTLDNFRAVFDEPTHTRAIVNTIQIGTVGGAITGAEGAMPLVADPSLELPPRCSGK